jgi:hypothetical protein
MPNEFDLKDEIHDKLKECRRRGLRFWFLKVHGHLMQRKGVPDYLLCYTGLFIALELKRPGEQPTALQTIELRMVVAAGGRAAVVTSWLEFCDVCRFPAWCRTVSRNNSGR